MPRFINDDVKLKHGGRKAARIDKLELGRLMLEKAMVYGDNFYGEDFDGVDETWYCDAHHSHRIIHALFYNDPAIKADNKFNVDGENNYVYDDEDYEPAEGDIGEHLMGMQTLDNGLTFYGFMAGGDWEFPVFMIIYYDGKKLRGYTPSYGNSVNLDFKSAIGSERSWVDVNEDKIIKEYKKLGIYRGDEDFEDGESLPELYFEKYELDIDTAGVNWNAIKQDIEARIEVAK